MTDIEREREAVDRAVDLLPELTERLRRHGLGEIEVARGDLRVRVAGVPAPTGPSAPATGSVAQPAPASVEGTAASTVAAEPVGVPSPAVGFFVYADGLGPGLAIDKGDALGHIEMLGVRHDVRAPRGGTVSHLVAESGEAVEYGQVVVELTPAEGDR